MSTKIHRQNLLAIATAYGRATGMSLGNVSKQFYGRGSGIKCFVDGTNSISVDKYYSMIDAFVAEWPEDAPWPALRAVVTGGPKRKPRRKRVVPKEVTAPLSQAG